MDADREIGGQERSSSQKQYREQFIDHGFSPPSPAIYATGSPLHKPLKGRPIRGRPDYRPRNLTG
jgi:hypothetical protein